VLILADGMAPRFSHSLSLAPWLRGGSDNAIASFCTKLPGCLDLLIAYKHHKTAVVVRVCSQGGDFGAVRRLHLVFIVHESERDCILM
jgi:hypothetical protein